MSDSWPRMAFKIKVWKFKKSENVSKHTGEYLGYEKPKEKLQL